MTSEKAKARRRYDAQFKAQVLAECAVPGASVAKVAMSHGINDNVVHRWRQLVREAGTVSAPRAPSFVPVALPAASQSCPHESCPAETVAVELRRGVTIVAIAWPSAALGALAAFTRELLR